MLRFAPVVILLAGAAPATAQIPSAAPAAQAKAQVSPLDRIVCRTEEGLGSRLSRKRVCMSMRDWQDQAQAARDATEKMQQQNQGIAPSG